MNRPTIDLNSTAAGAVGLKTITKEKSVSISLETLLTVF